MLTESPWGSLVSMLAAVAVIIGLAYWFTRYLVGSGRFQSIGMSQNRDQLRVVAQTPVGKDQRLAVVQVGERYFFVGMTLQNISLLAELSEDEARLWHQKEGAREVPQKQMPTFQQAFMDSLRKRK